MIPEVARPSFLAENIGGIFGHYKKEVESLILMENGLSDTIARLKVRGGQVK
jgi:hypothetical protein